MDRAGLETMLMNYYRALDRDTIQFDFLTHRPQRGAYDDEIESMGGRIYRAPRLYPQNFLAYRRYMRRLFSEHQYPIIHSHIDAMSTFPLTLASECGVEVRIAHSHNDDVDKDLRYPAKELARRILPRVATHYFACSSDAGAFLFGEENRSRVKVVKNAIDLERFRYSEDVRRQVRNDLGILPDQCLIGHIGRFSTVKNHKLLVRLLLELKQRRSNSALVMVGDGELRETTERAVHRMGLSSMTRFLGPRADIDRLVQALDVMVLPSFHEGIPVTLIEAQASGLPVLASNRVSRETLILESSVSLGLDRPIAEWADETLNLVSRGRTADATSIVAAAGYDIRAGVEELSETYLALQSKGL